jgi:hypothetical protein
LPIALVLTGTGAAPFRMALWGRAVYASERLSRRLERSRSRARGQLRRFLPSSVPASEAQAVLARPRSDQLARLGLLAVAV